MSKTLDQPLTPRNVFIQATQNDISKLDKRTIENLKQALLIVNLYNGRLKNYPIEEASFNYTQSVALTGESEPVGINGLQDARHVNRYVRKSLNQMALNDAAVKFLFGNKDQNSQTDNRLLETVLNKAIGMINPYKVTELENHIISSKLDELNTEYKQVTEGKIQQLKDLNVFHEFNSQTETPSMMGRIRRIIS